jgi:RNA polymerase sigma-70 factor (ECF subfamily)
MTFQTFEKEIVPLKHPIYRYAMYMLKNTEDAQDVTQEVLIKIWNKRDDVDAISNKRAWAIKIARNTCLDLIKSRKGEFISWEDNLDKPSHSTPYESLRFNDEKNLIEQLMERLPSIQKEVFYLRHFEDNSYQEISEMLALDMNNVKVNLHRARVFIKKELEEKHNYGLKTG